MPSPTRFGTSYADAYSPSSSPSQHLDKPLEPLVYPTKGRESTEYGHRYKLASKDSASQEYVPPSQEALHQSKEIRNLNMKIQDMMRSTAKTQQQDANQVQTAQAALHQQASNRVMTKSPQRENTEYGDRYQTSPTLFDNRHHNGANYQTTTHSDDAETKSLHARLTQSEYTNKYVSKHAEEEAIHAPKKDTDSWATKLNFERAHSPGRKETEYGERYDAELKKLQNDLSKDKFLTLSTDIIKIQSGDNVRDSKKPEQQEIKQAPNKVTQAITEYTDEYHRQATKEPKKFEVYHDDFHHNQKSNLSPRIEIVRSKSPGRENTEYGVQYTKSSGSPTVFKEYHSGDHAVKEAKPDRDIDTPRRKIIFADQMKQQVDQKWSEDHSHHRASYSSPNRDNTEYGQRYTPKSLTEDKDISNIYTSTYEAENKLSQSSIAANVGARASSPKREETEYGQRYTPKSLTENKDIANIYTSAYEDEALASPAATNHRVSRSPSPKRGDTEYGTQYVERQKVARGRS